MSTFWLVFLVIFGASFLCISAARAARPTLAQGARKGATNEEITSGCVIGILMGALQFLAIYWATMIIMSLVE